MKVIMVILMCMFSSITYSQKDNLPVWRFESYKLLKQNLIDTSQKKLYSGKFIIVADLKKQTVITFPSGDSLDIISQLDVKQIKQDIDFIISFKTISRNSLYCDVDILFNGGVPTAVRLKYDKVLYFYFIKPE